MCQRSRRALRCRHADAVVPVCWQSDFRCADKIVGRTRHKEAALRIDLQFLQSQTVRPWIGLVKSRPFRSDDDGEIDSQAIRRYLPKPLGAVRYHTERDTSGCEGSQGFLHVRPGLQFPVARRKFRCKTTPQAHGRSRLGDEILVSSVGPSLVGDPQVLSAPSTPALGIARDRIPKRPAIEERGQKVKQNGIVAANAASS